MIWWKRLYNALEYATHLSVIQRAETFRTSTHELSSLWFAASYATRLQSHRNYAQEFKSNASLYTKHIQRLVNNLRIGCRNWKKTYKVTRKYSAHYGRNCACYSKVNAAMKLTFQQTDLPAMNYLSFTQPHFQLPALLILHRFSNPPQLIPASATL